MRYVPGRHSVLGCLFFGIGYFLIRSKPWDTERLLHVEWFAKLFFPNNLAYQYLFHGIIDFGILATAGLCFLTGFGAVRKARWARWVGLPACIYLLLGFPYLTAAGALCLYLLFTQDVSQKRPVKDFWDPSRGSILRTAIFFISWIFASRIAMSLGAGRLSTLSVVLLIFVHVAIHELGHAAGALLAGYRLKEIAVGPLIYRYGPPKPGFSFSWGNLLNAIAGYMGAVPTSRENIWEKEAALVAAGPFASILGGVAFLAGFAIAPGPLAAYGAMIGFHMGLTNLIPLGYTDGTMLFHLLFHTRRGEELIERILSSGERDAAQQKENAGEFEELAAVHRAALDRLLESKTPDPNRLAIAYIELGRAESPASQQQAAIEHLQRGLELLSEGHSPYHSLVAWLSLHRIYMTQFNAPAAEKAYQESLAAYEVFHAQTAGQSGAAWHHPTNLAELHVYAEAFEAALPCTALALRNLPPAAEHRMMRARLLGMRAHAALQTGNFTFGLAATEEAASILLPETRNPTNAVQAEEALRILCQRLWGSDQRLRAIGLLSEMVASLETPGMQSHALPAAKSRVLLASFLQRESRLTDALEALPADEHVPMGLRIELLRIRAEILGAMGKTSEALEDHSEGMRLVLANSPNDTVEIAVAKTCLADAYLAAGNLAQAKLLSKQAYEALQEIRHPGCADSCITLALVAYQKGDSPGTLFEEALKRLTEESLMLRITKVNCLLNSAKHIERFGTSAQAAPFRAAADGLRHSDRAASPAPIESPTTEVFAATLESV